MPYKWAKVRSRSKYLKKVVLVQDPERGGVHDYLMGDVYPFGSGWHESEAQAMQTLEKRLKIRPSDWIQESGDFEFHAHIQAATESAVSSYVQHVTKRAPGVDSPKPVLPWTKPSRGDNRRIKSLIIGTWRWEDHVLDLSKEGSWKLEFQKSLRLKPWMSWGTSGTYSYSNGFIGFVAGTFGFALAIAGVPNDSLTLTDGTTFTATFRRES